MASNLTFFRTNTRFFGIIMPEGTTITIEHASRTEAVDASGMILGGDITKDGTPVDVPEKACIRRIEVPAILGAGWKIDKEAEQECNSLTRLADDMDRLVKDCGNETYKAAWLAVRAQVELGKVEFHIFRQFCGIKIGVCKAPMDTEVRRAGYARLMRHANGNSEDRSSFNTDHAFRWLVVEPYDNKTGGGYLVDEYGMSVGKIADGINYSPGHDGKLYEGTALYNKPEADAEKHWIPVPAEEAEKTLALHDKSIPYDFIAVAQKLFEIVEAMNEPRMPIGVSGSSSEA